MAILAEMVMIDSRMDLLENDIIMNMDKTFFLINMDIASNGSHSQMAF